MINSFRDASIKAESRDHGHMIERTALPGALLVDRALAAPGQHDAGRAHLFDGGIGAQPAFEAKPDMFQNKRVGARS